MRAAVIGASGAMGSKIVRILQRDGFDVVAASTKTGVNAYTGEGLEVALAGADVVIDVTNSGSFGEGNALDFFKRAGRNLLTAAKSSGAKHYMALSVVGTDRLVENDYFRAKLVQENLIRSSGLPYTILRSTQFFEFFSSIVNDFAVDGSLKVPSIAVQPVSADEAANWITKLASSTPHNAIVELAGPESIQLVDLVRELLTATEDARLVSLAPAALYFGVELPRDGMLPITQALSGKLSFHDWLSRNVAA
ncbi:SDR family oxidoreductase [Rhizobium mayense]|uniref:NmrA family NAD(P)-binding protein n=1 Tax=Rhizobium mayense TaxID=1312184 RepID=A0ABT7JUV3_9HYPH|nr:NmrA family NAD(P)-binding protein [Rhizobium mayense]MDL2398978.1 NmrA family NAD(P)-binding protein [Rhizobium mayense]